MARQRRLFCAAAFAVNAREAYRIQNSGPRGAGRGRDLHFGPSPLRKSAASEEDHEHGGHAHKEENGDAHYDDRLSRHKRVVLHQEEDQDADDIVAKSSSRMRNGSKTPSRRQQRDVHEEEQDYDTQALAQDAASKEGLALDEDADEDADENQSQESQSPNRSRTGTSLATSLHESSAHTDRTSKNRHVALASSSSSSKAGSRSSSKSSLTRTSGSSRTRRTRRGSKSEDKPAAPAQKQRVLSADEAKRLLAGLDSSAEGVEAEKSKGDSQSNEEQSSQPKQAEQETQQQEQVNPNQAQQQRKSETKQGEAPRHSRDEPASKNAVKQELPEPSETKKYTSRTTDGDHELPLDVDVEEYNATGNGTNATTLQGESEENTNTGILGSALGSVYNALSALEELLVGEEYAGDLREAMGELTDEAADQGDDAVHAVKNAKEAPKDFKESLKQTFLAAFGMLFGERKGPKVAAASTLKLPKLDERKFGFLTLDNGLRVLVVQDKLAAKSAMGMAVKTGSVNDPVDVAGLAHFTEHMLFLGSEKYPDPEEFGRVISECDGSDNAYTDQDRTVYFNDFSPQCLETVAPVFAGFFEKATLNATMTEKEVNAVDQEHAKNKNNMMRRLFELMRGRSASVGHPYAKFFTGNKETLYDVPMKKGIPIADRLRSFYDQYYCPTNQALVILGSEPITKLSEVAKAYFSFERECVEPTLTAEELAAQEELARQIAEAEAKALAEAEGNQVNGLLLQQGHSLSSPVSSKRIRAGQEYDHHDQGDKKIKKHQDHKKNDVEMQTENEKEMLALFQTAEEVIEKSQYEQSSLHKSSISSETTKQSSNAAQGQGSQTKTKRSMKAGDDVLACPEASPQEASDFPYSEAYPLQSMRRLFTTKTLSKPEMWIMFPIRIGDLMHKYQYGIDSYLSYLSGDAGPNSFRTVMKKRGLLTDLSMWYTPGVAGSQVFFILHLTDKGDKQIHTVLMFFFGYMAAVRMQGVDEDYYKSIQKNAEVQFAWSMRSSDQMEAAASLANAMTLYADDDVVSGASLTNVMKPCLIGKVLTFLQSSNANFGYATKRQELLHNLPKTVPYYDMKYREEKLTEGLLTEFQSAEFPVEMMLPGALQYIPRLEQDLRPVRDQKDVPDWHPELGLYTMDPQPDTITPKTIIGFKVEEVHHKSEVEIESTGNLVSRRREGPVVQQKPEIGNGPVGANKKTTAASSAATAQRVAAPTGPKTAASVLSRKKTDEARVPTSPKMASTADAKSSGIVDFPAPAPLNAPTAAQDEQPSVPGRKRVVGQNKHHKNHPLPSDVFKSAVPPASANHPAQRPVANQVETAPATGKAQSSLVDPAQTSVEDTKKLMAAAGEIKARSKDAFGRTLDLAENRHAAHASFGEKQRKIEKDAARPGLDSSLVHLRQRTYAGRRQQPGHGPGMFELRRRQEDFPSSHTDADAHDDAAEDGSDVEEAGFETHDVGNERYDHEQDQVLSADFGEEDIREDEAASRSSDALQFLQQDTSRTADERKRHAKRDDEKSPPKKHETKVTLSSKVGTDSSREKASRSSTDKGGAVISETSSIKGDTFAGMQTVGHRTLVVSTVFKYTSSTTSTTTTTPTPPTDSNSNTASTSTATTTIMTELRTESQRAEAYAQEATTGAAQEATTGAAQEATTGASQEKTTTEASITEEAIAGAAAHAANEAANAKTAEATAAEQAAAAATVARIAAEEAAQAAARQAAAAALAAMQADSDSASQAAAAKAAADAAAEQAAEEAAAVRAAEEAALAKAAQEAKDARAAHEVADLKEAEAVEEEQQADEEEENRRAESQSTTEMPPLSEEHEAATGTTNQRSGPGTNSQEQVAQILKNVPDLKKQILQAIHHNIAGYQLEAELDKFANVGNSYSFGVSSTGMSFSFQGFPDHLEEMMKLVVPRAVNPIARSVDSELELRKQFRFVVQNMRANLMDVSNILAVQHSSSYQGLVLSAEAFSREEKLAFVSKYYNPPAGSPDAEAASTKESSSNTDEDGGVQGGISSRGQETQGGKESVPTTSLALQSMRDKGATKKGGDRRTHSSTKEIKRSALAARALKELKKAENIAADLRKRRASRGSMDESVTEAEKRLVRVEEIMTSLQNYAEKHGSKSGKTSNSEEADSNEDDRESNVDKDAEEEEEEDDDALKAQNQNVGKIEEDDESESFESSAISFLQSLQDSELSFQDEDEAEDPFEGTNLASLYDDFQTYLKRPDMKVKLKVTAFSVGNMRYEQAVSMTSLMRDLISRADAREVLRADRNATYNLHDSAPNSLAEAHSAANDKYRHLRHEHAVRNVLSSRHSAAHSNTALYEGDNKPLSMTTDAAMSAGIAHMQAVAAARRSAARPGLPFGSLFSTNSACGNRTEDEERKEGEEIKKMFVPVYEPVVLNPGERIEMRLQNPIPTDDNDAIRVTYQFGIPDVKEKALLNILAPLVQKETFSFLRTEKQLGYIVFGHIAPTGNVVELSIGVQGTKMTPDQIEALVTENNKRIRNLLMNMPLLEIEKRRDALISSLETPHANLAEQYDAVWTQIAGDHLCFQLKQWMLEYLKGYMLPAAALEEAHDIDDLTDDAKEAQQIAEEASQEEEGAAAQVVPQSSSDKRAGEETATAEEQVFSPESQQEAESYSTTPAPDSSIADIDDQNQEKDTLADKMYEKDENELDQEVVEQDQEREQEQEVTSNSTTSSETTEGGPSLTEKGDNEGLEVDLLEGHDNFGYDNEEASSSFLQVEETPKSKKQGHPLQQRFTSHSTSASLARVTSAKKRTLVALHNAEGGRAEQYRRARKRERKLEEMIVREAMMLSEVRKEIRNGFGGWQSTSPLQIVEVGRRSMAEEKFMRKRGSAAGQPDERSMLAQGHKYVRKIHGKANAAFRGKQERLQQGRASSSSKDKATMSKAQYTSSSSTRTELEKAKAQALHTVQNDLVAVWDKFFKEDPIVVKLYGTDSAKKMKSALQEAATGVGEGGICKALPSKTTNKSSFAEMHRRATQSIATSASSRSPATPLHDTCLLTEVPDSHDKQEIFRTQHFTSYSRDIVCRPYKPPGEGQQQLFL